MTEAGGSPAAGTAQGARRPRPRRLLGAAAAVAALVTAGAAVLTLRLDRRAQRELKEVDQMLAPERRAFRAEKDAEMKGDLSPLSRVDYIHLPPGETLAGGEALPLPAGVALAPGSLRLLASGGALTLRANPPVPVGGVPKEEAELKNGDVLTVGRLRLLVAGLPGDPAVAIYDPEAPARRAYAGLHYFPDDSRYTAVGTLARYEAPRKVQVEASRGGPQRMNAVGVVHFELDGKPQELEAYESGPAMLFLIFKDETNQGAGGGPGESYGAGRFLYARLAAGDKVLLDFNQAWNPLCAYSRFFHCPLPPRRNWLKLRVPAGERAYGDH